MAKYSVVGAKTKYKKGSKRRKFAIALTLLALCAILFALYFYRRSMNPIILDIAQTRLKAETTLAVNEAVCAVLADETDYSRFVTVEKNDQNDVVMLSANSALVNTLARSTAILTQKKIEQLKSFVVDIPIGTLSGIPLLSELGDSVCVTVSPIGNVNCTFTSAFETAGINQTLHRIYINVVCKVDLIMPTMHAEVETNTPILLCESLILGKVPNTFLQGGLLLGSS